MSKKSTDLLRLWEHAKPSRDAPLAFLPDHCFPDGTARADFFEPKCTVPALLTILQERTKEAQGGNMGLPGLQDALAATAALDSERNRLNELGKVVVMQALRSGTLRAFGFDEPRKLEDQPVELAAKHFGGTAHFRWDTGVLRSSGMRIVEVRFIPSQNADALIASWLKEEAEQMASGLDQIETKRVGRPTIKPQVEAAFNMLLEAGKIDLRASRRSHFPAIKQAIAMQNLGSDAPKKVLSDEAIRRLTKPLFDAAMKARTVRKKG